MLSGWSRQEHSNGPKKSIACAGGPKQKLLSSLPKRMSFKWLDKRNDVEITCHVMLFGTGNR